MNKLKIQRKLKRNIHFANKQKLGIVLLNFKKEC